ncbi:MAG: hypothetical protein LBT29_02770 [Flavobacteriaceae bacterium]|nr:hypothetical protein [Flavobacteriaceae bacterium]
MTTKCFTYRLFNSPPLEGQGVVISTRWVVTANQPPRPADTPPKEGN